MMHDALNGSTVHCECCDSALVPQLHSVQLQCGRHARSQARDPVAADGTLALRQRMLQAQVLGQADLAAQVRSE